LQLSYFLWHVEENTNTTTIKRIPLMQNTTQQLITIMVTTTAMPTPT
jgi:hypothetical protein